MSTNNSTMMGTAGGTLLSLVPNIYSADIVKTVLLASIGAIVSFTISMILKRILKKRKR